MKTKPTAKLSRLPQTLAPHFQEFDLKNLDVQQDALTIMQRTLEYGDLTELRWLFAVYRRDQIREFVRTRGEFWLSARAFYFWRRYFKLKNWRRAPHQTLREQLWPF